MSTSNVRNIESLEHFHGQLVRLSSDWMQSLEEIRLLVHRANEHFSRDQPTYWRRQRQLAERELNEAKDNLSRQQSAVRAQDRPAASEAVKRVRSAERRSKECERKVRHAKAASIELGQICDDLLGPLADLTEHCEVVLPSAAHQLRTLIDQLRQYAEHAKHPPPS